MLRDINFSTFKKMLNKKKLRKIVIDIDSRSVNVEGNQEGAVKEIIANIKDSVDNIVFRMDSGYFSEEIAKVIEEAGYQYVVKAKEYTNLLALF